MRFYVNKYVVFSVNNKQFDRPEQKVFIQLITAICAV